MSSSSKSDDRLKVGVLARKTGKSVRALRLYEELGLLKPGRSQGGFRLYGPDEVARVYWIAKLQDMGFSLAQIQELVRTVEGSDNGPDAMTSLREMFRGRLSTTRARVEKLLQLERDLSESLAYLEGCRSCSAEHDLDACVTCDSVHAQTEAPSLVAGVHLTPASSLRDGVAPTTPASSSRDGVAPTTPVSSSRDGVAPTTAALSSPDGVASTTRAPRSHDRVARARPSEV